MTRLWPDWTGQTVVIVATGPSASDVHLAQGRAQARYLAIKDAWRLCPWAEILYGCDDHWWQEHHGVPEFKGLKAAYGPQAIKQFGCLPVRIDSAHTRMQFGEVGKVGWGGNSGYHAINLAVQMGARDIILVGFDFRVDRGLHFFGAHRYGNKRPNEKSAEGWRQLLDGEADTLKKMGVRIINCSMVSTLRSFPKMDFQEALDACRSFPSRLRLEAGSERDDCLQGGHGTACDDCMRCEGCREGQGRDHQETAPEES